MLPLWGGGAAATPVPCICHFWSGLPQFLLCSQEGPKDPEISLTCRGGYRWTIAEHCPDALLRPYFCIRGHFLAEDGFPRDSLLLTDMSKVKINDFIVIGVLGILNVNLG